MNEQDEIASVYAALPKGTVQPGGWLKFDDVRQFVEVARAVLSASLDPDADRYRKMMSTFMPVLTVEVTRDRDGTSPCAYIPFPSWPDLSRYLDAHIPKEP